MEPNLYSPQCLYGVDRGDIIASVILVMQYAVCLLGGGNIIFNSLAEQPPPPWVRASSLSRLHDHRHTTVGRTPLDE